MKYSRQKSFSEKMRDILLDSKKLFSLLSLFLIVLALPVVLVLTQHRQTYQEHASGGYPHVLGAQIIDGNGNPLYLRGAMIETAFAYIKRWQGGQDPLATLNSTTFTAMVKQWHMNILRTNISQYIYNLDPITYMNKLDTAIQQANAAGLYVVLDYHNDTQSGSPYGDAMLHTSDLNWWKTIAFHYAGNSMVMFDVINEPGYPDWCSWRYGGNPQGCTTSITNTDVVGVIDVVKAIRSTGAQQIIVVEPGKAGGTRQEDAGWATFDPSILTDSNTIVSKHEYHNVISGNPSSWNLSWGPFLTSSPRPLYYGEWAVLPNAAIVYHCTGLTNVNADQVTNTFLSYMDTIHANWTAWNFVIDHMVQDTVNFTPTTMHLPGDAAWSCGDTSTAHLGMGTDVLNFILSHPIPIITSPTPTVTATPTLQQSPTPSPTPKIPPSVIITSPTNGSIIQRHTTITITANASDTVGVTKVEFLIDGSLACTSLNAPYKCSWSDTGKPNATYTLQAKAYDTAGNTAINQIQVTSSH